MHPFPRLNKHQLLSFSVSYSPREYVLYPPLTLYVHLHPAHLPLDWPNLPLLVTLDPWHLLGITFACRDSFFMLLMAGIDVDDRGDVGVPWSDMVGKLFPGL